MASESQTKYQAYEEKRKKALDDMEMREQEIKDLTDQEEELLRQISMTGYEQLKGQLVSLNQLIESLARSKARWEQTATALKAWEEEDSVSNRVLWDIDEFARGTISGEVLDRLKHGLEEQTERCSQTAAGAQSEIRQL